MEIKTPYRPTAGFDGLYGLVVTEIGREAIRGHVPVRDELLQPAGLVHGGVYAAIAESLASMATALAVADEGRVAMGSSNLTTFLRPITAGTIHGLGRSRHRGRTTWVWELELSDDDGRTCVLSRVTVAVREARPGASAPTL